MVDDKNTFAMAKDRHEVIFLLGGAVSVCWTPKPAGVFNSEEARDYCQEALDRLKEMEEPLLGLATTQQLIEELKARMETQQHIPGATTRELTAAAGAGQACAIMLGDLPKSVLIYRTVDS